MVKVGEHSGGARTVAADAPFLIKFDEEHQARALADTLTGIRETSVQQDGSKWKVALACPKTDGVVVQVLDAVRRIIAGSPSSLVQLVLDGRDYYMRGE